MKVRWSVSLLKKVAFLCISMTVIIFINKYFGTSLLKRNFREDVSLTPRPDLHVDLIGTDYPEEKYHIIPNIATSDYYMGVHPTGKGDIAICTQTSLSNIYMITDLVDIWNGQVSMAVFAFDENINHAVQYIFLLKRCSIKVHKNVQFHLVFPGSYSLSHSNLSEKDTSYQHLARYKDQYKEENYRLGGVPYPVNVLRNVALMYVNTAYVLNLDVDFLPSKGLRVQMIAFLNGIDATKKQRKFMFVLPAFESSNISNASMLNSKQELISTVKNNTVRQFHVKNFPAGHNATNYSRWLGLPRQDTMDIAYTVEYTPNYEPFYIASKLHLPMFHGQYKQYGINRISQICEAYVSGFDLVVMNNGFVVHDGFKELRAEDNWKQVFNAKNRRYFEKVFKPALKFKYPDSNRTC